MHRTRRPLIAHRYGPAILLLLMATTPSTHASESATPRTWNPWGKESPEPYGYDVTTAPDLPLGYVDPEDPPALFDASLALLCTRANRSTLTVVTSCDRTAYSWFGAITVTADVSLLGTPVANCDSVIALSAANPRVRARLRDDGVLPDLVGSDGRYTGRFDIDAGEGEARPTGTYSVTAAAYRGADSGSDPSGNVSVYSVRRWTGVSTTDLPDASDAYTMFYATPNGPGAGYHHRIEKFGLVRSTAVSNAQIRIPILPRTNPITNLAVSGTGVSNLSLVDNVIAFDCNLTGSTVTRVDISFDAPSDLCLTRIDRYQTGDIGLRDFRNGYLIWNRYIHTAMLGSGFSSPHGPACFVDLHVTDQASGAPHTVDCMERVAVHLDDVAHDDGTGTYQSNIKWGGDALSWLELAESDHVTFRTFSGGAYGLAQKVAVERTVEFFAESRYFRHDYRMRNIDAVAHDMDFVWGREQWLYGSGAGSNRDEDDRGILPVDPASYGGESRRGPSEIDGNWFAAFDATSFYSIGVMLPGDDVAAMPTFAHFLCQPALGNFPGEYPITPSGTCTDMPNLFFEKQLGLVAPNETRGFVFYQWGGYGATRAELTQILDDDANAVLGNPSDVDAGGLRSIASLPFLHAPAPNPVSSATEIAFELNAAATATLAVYDVNGRRVRTLADAWFSAGRHAVEWDPRVVGTRPLSPGAYLIRLDAGGRSVARKVVVLP